jgi:uncharacterized protein DUF6084
VAAVPDQAARDLIPQLRFAVQGADGLAYAAVPTLSFELRVDAPAGQPIRSVLLDVQIQIAARARGYEPAAQQRLLELFGPVSDWGTNLRTLPWLRTTAVVPAFTDSTVVALTVPCTYDLEVTAARYLAALDGGFVPLELLFSGTVFYTGPGGNLQTARIAWDNEVHYALPVAVWRRTMDRHFPNAAWLRLGSDSFARLCAYKARHAFTSWDAAVDSLLEGRDG